LAPTQGWNAQPPTLVVQGMELPGEKFLAFFDDPALMPAEAPAGTVVMRGGGLYGEAQLSVQVMSMNAMDKLTFGGGDPAPQIEGMQGVEGLGALAYGSPSGLTIPGDIPPPTIPDNPVKITPEAPIIFPDKADR